ncbi:hypothetical protein [Candidatus Parabeggiatoa sp. HSG14]|uniref:hypothetical protein n=1 Tax=Candidatus Parabeggiatoa sp. HSG14 TaxID=3055593 RepID=UPI0025A8828D|nr:hypothetical protein [Thiotrichales bacterium HSG14]
MLTNVNKIVISNLGINNYYPFFTHQSEVEHIEKGYKIKSKFQPHVGCSYGPCGMAVSGKDIRIEMKE